MIKALIASSLVLNLGLLLGRMSGFVREAIVASSYGATPTSDIVVLLLTAPDVLINILMGGAMGAALIPAFAQSPERARQLLFQVMLLVIAVFSSIVWLCLSLMPEFVGLLAPGFSQAKIEQASQLLRWVIWLLPLTVLAGATTAYLQAQNKFAVAGLGTLIINSVIILGLIYAQMNQSLIILAICILIGGGLRLISQLAQVKWQWQPYQALFPNLLDRTLLNRYFQAMMAGSILLLMPVIARAMASFAGDGGLSMFNYALKLIEFPLAIAVSFVGIVLFPRIAKSFVEDMNLHHQLIKIGVQVTIILAIIAMVSLQALSADYVHVVYGYGKMDMAGRAQITELIRIGLLVLPLQGLAVFLTLTFNARNETKKPMIINMIGLCCFVLLITTESVSNNLFSLMWALVISYAIICCLQLIILKINDFKWAQVLLDQRFLLSLIIMIPPLYYVNAKLSAAAILSWQALVFAGIASLAALFGIALLNMYFGKAIMTKLGFK